MASKAEAMRAAPPTYRCSGSGEGFTAMAAKIVRMPPPCDPVDDEVGARLQRAHPMLAQPLVPGAREMEVWLRNDLAAGSSDSFAILVAGPFALVEDNECRRVFDGVWPHIAGAARGSFNARFGTPIRPLGAKINLSTNTMYDRNREFINGDENASQILRSTMSV